MVRVIELPSQNKYPDGKINPANGLIIPGTLREIVPDSSGNVTVLSDVGSVIARVVSNSLSAAPSNIMLPFNSMSFLTIKLILANEVHYPLRKIITHYAAPWGLRIDVEITFAVALVGLVTATLSNTFDPLRVAVKTGNRL